MTKPATPHLYSEATAYNSIFAQYVSESSFLWQLRAIAISEPHHSNQDILLLDQRIEEQLNGLMSSLEQGWESCVEAMDMDDPGELFTAMVVAMRSHDQDRIRHAVDVGCYSQQAFKGIVSAMAWLPPEITRIWIKRFLNGKDLNHKYLGVSVCSECRYDPGNVIVSILQREDCIKNMQLYARSIRLVGELARKDCIPYINTVTHSDIDSIRFWSNWSLVLLGQREKSVNLKSFVLRKNKYQDKAIQIAFRVLDIDIAREWISELSNDESMNRAAIKATGVLGDPHAINWLIQKMNNPLYAKLAAESFFLITGIDLVSSNLAIPPPEKNPDILDEDLDDEFIGLDEDENLPYPDIKKVASVWEKYGRQFIVGKRYFMGDVITLDILNDTLKHGTQRYRKAAALEKALNNGKPLINTALHTSLI